MEQILCKRTAAARDGAVEASTLRSRMLVTLVLPDGLSGSGARVIAGALRIEGALPVLRTIHGDPGKKCCAAACDDLASAALDAYALGAAGMAAFNFQYYRPFADSACTYEEDQPFHEPLYGALRGLNDPGWCASQHQHYWCHRSLGERSLLGPRGGPRSSLPPFHTHHKRGCLTHPSLRSSRGRGPGLTSRLFVADHKRAGRTDGVVESGQSAGH